MIANVRNIGSVAEWTTATIAFVALFLSIVEYQRIKNRERYATLAEYNKRYSTDSNLKVVINFLNDYNDGKKCILPNVYELDMFFRFFEELQLQIEAGKLEEEIVSNLFVYYGIMAFMNPEIEKCADINKQENWVIFYKFLKKFKSDATSICKELKEKKSSFDIEQYKRITNL